MAHTGKCTICKKVFVDLWEHADYMHSYPEKHHNPDNGRWCYGPIVHDPACEQVDLEEQ